MRTPVSSQQPLLRCRRRRSTTTGYAQPGRRPGRRGAFGEHPCELRRGDRYRPSDPGPEARVSSRCCRREPQRITARRSLPAQRPRAWASVARPVTRVTCASGVPSRSGGLPVRAESPAHAAETLPRPGRTPSCSTSDHHNRRTVPESTVQSVAMSVACGIWRGVRPGLVRSWPGRVRVRRRPGPKWYRRDGRGRDG